MPPGFLRSAAGDGGGPVLKAPRDCKGRGPRQAMLGRLSPGSQILMATGYKHRLVGGLEKDPASPFLISRALTLPTGQAEEC